MLDTEFGSARLISALELSRYLGVSLAAVRKWTRKGLPHVRAGRLVRYQVAEVIAHLRQQQAK